MQILEVLEKKCQNYRFFDIFWDILEKKKGKFWSRMWKIRGLYPFRAKLEQLLLISLEK